MKDSILLIGCGIMAIGVLLSLSVHIFFFALVFLGLIVCACIIKKLDKDE